MEELEALLALNHLSYIGSIKIRSLMQHFGSALAVLKAPLSELSAFPGFGPKILQYWEAGTKESAWKDDLILAERLETQIIPFTSPHYPKRLLEIPDFPLILYMQGELLKQDQRCLSVIGTRQASIYGQEMAKQLSRELAQAGFTIVSGLARGIDTAAHLGALEGGRSIAILGSGLASIYPRENLLLANSLKEKGAVISEFSMTTPPDRQHFPQRNRIVSGMSMGTLLIEAPKQSGAMLTVEKAISQKRAIFALPGRVDQETFTGNHYLIKEGKAGLVENTHDIIKYFDDYSLPLVFNSSKRQLDIALEGNEKDLLQKMPTQEISIEELIVKIGWPAAKLNSLLMGLVLKNMVKEYPGKTYKKI